MKKAIISSIILATSVISHAGVPDSVYVRAYGTERGDGLHLEWSANQQEWQKVITGTVITSDYGNWGGRGKKMFFPNIIQGHNGEYVLVFQVATGVNQFGVTTTKDFWHWQPQDYPYMKGVKQCLHPFIRKTDEGYDITFESDERYYKTSSTDLIHFTDPVEVERSRPERISTRIPYSRVRALQGRKGLNYLRDQVFSERAKDDDKRFGDMEGVGVQVVVEGAQPKTISDRLMGIFFEDINYAADGGLYAELIQNRDFEYTADDHQGWNALTSWNLQGTGATMEVKQDAPIHPNNPHYAQLTITNAQDAVLQNAGYDGIAVRKGEKYDLSAFLRLDEGKTAKLTFSLQDGDKVVASTTLTAATPQWKQSQAVLTAQADCPHAVLCIRSATPAKLSLDFVSLFPQQTFRGRKNGLRKDLAETLEALHPQFMRFPGGCVAHGDGLDNMYRWKETIGKPWERKPQFNIWHYHQSKGLGFYEYFLFCEDLRMEPLPVLAAGVPCQNSSHGGYGQQGGVPMEEMDAYVQDVLDLIEWANGDAKTTKWGRVRAELGHPKPFHLKYIGIGNEDLISSVFKERYLMIVKAVKERYPEITVCGTVGPFYEGSDYEEGWKVANEHHIDMVDEHYYVSPGWMIHNQRFYDQYDRSQSKVYLGEYAAHIDGRKSTIETALACAMHLCNIERNGDIVELTSYAPLLAKEGHTQWNPDMIYFNNTEVHPTVDYYAQMLHGQHMGGTYLRSTIHSPERKEGLDERLAVSTVRNEKTGKTYLKIVSLLPMPAFTHLSLRDMGLDGQKRDCKATVLSGAQDSQTATPRDTSFQISNDCLIKLDPYSFTIIEL